MSRKSLILSLMLTSLVLLIILQAFWLRNSYERSYFGFRREANWLFRNALYGLRDSLMAEGVVPVSSDSANWTDPDRVEVRLRGKDAPGQVLQSDSGNIQIFFSSEVRADTLKTVIAPLTSQIRSRRAMRSSRYIVRMGPDTLNRDSVYAEFSRSLSLAEINLPFRIRHETHAPHDFFHEGMSNVFSRDRGSSQGAPHIYGDSLDTEMYPINPLHRYSASFGDVRSYIIGRIGRQIGFCVFLTLMIGGAYLLMFRSLRAQERLMEMKNDFIRNVTHELKTPVATVSVALEALSNFKAMNNPEKTEEYLTIARYELERLNLLTDKVLKAAVFEDKGISFTPETVDLRKVADKVTNSFRLLFEREGASIKLTTEGENLTLQGSEDHLTNMLYNLVENAFKYSPSVKEVVVTLREEANAIELTVSDKGVGIDPVYHRKIFEKFFRIPNGDVHNFKGHGLGLSYVAGVVNAHKGTISVASRTGHGSVFTVKLPR